VSATHNETHIGSCSANWVIDVCAAVLIGNPIRHGSKRERRLAGATAVAQEVSSSIGRE
jgi:hypothetical protein